MRKKVADEKKEMLLTGGGPSSKILRNDDIDAILLSIVNEKTVHGLNNPCDSDIIKVTSANTEEHDVEFVFNEENLNVESAEKCLDSDPESSHVTERGASWTHYTPSDLTRPKNPILESKEKNLNSTIKTPSRRRPSSAVKTLTSSIVAQKYDILLDKRLVLIEKQIKQVEDEHDLKIKKKNLEIESLQLDISIKKKQLSLM